jgi:hypothetical protein
MVLYIVHTSTGILEVRRKLSNALRVVRHILRTQGFYVDRAENVAETYSIDDNDESLHRPGAPYRMWEIDWGTEQCDYLWLTRAELGGKPKTGAEDGQHKELEGTMAAMASTNNALLASEAEVRRLRVLLDRAIGQHDETKTEVKYWRERAFQAESQSKTLVTEALSGRIQELVRENNKALAEVERLTKGLGAVRFLNDEAKAREDAAIRALTVERDEARAEVERLKKHPCRDGIGSCRAETPFDLCAACALEQRADSLEGEIKRLESLVDRCTHGYEFYTEGSEEHQRLYGRKSRECAFPTEETE